MGDLLIILIIVVAIVGRGRVRETVSGVGEAVRNFKREVSGPDEIDITPRSEGTKK